MDRKHFVLVLIVTALFLFAIGATWVMAKGNGDGYEGRRIVVHECIFEGSNVCNAVCPEGFVLVGGGGDAWVKSGEFRPIHMQPYCSTGDEQPCIFNDADTWRVVAEFGGETEFMIRSFAICFEERFGSFIPMASYP